MQIPGCRCSAHERRNGIMASRQAGLVIALIHIVFIATVITQNPECTASDVNFCDQQYDIIQTEAIYSSQSFDPGAAQNATVIRDHCRKVNSMLNCIAPVRSNCGPPAVAKVEKLKALFGYLCGEGLETYIQNIDCLNADFYERQEDINQCLQSFSTSFNRLKNNQNMRDSRKYRKYCRLSESYLNCIVLPYRKCGKDVLNIFFKMQKDILEYTLAGSGYKCKMRPLREHDNGTGKEKNGDAPGTHNERSTKSRQEQSVVKLAVKSGVGSSSRRQNLTLFFVLVNISFYCIVLAM